MEDSSSLESHYLSDRTADRVRGPRNRPQTRAEGARRDVVGAADDGEIVVESDAVRQVERVDLHADPCGYSADEIVTN